MVASRARRGNALIEFTLAGIPIIFMLISIFEMARGMWTYDTLAYAVRRGLRSAIVHGQTCASGGNNCIWTVGQVAQAIRQAGVGLDPQRLSVTLISESGSISCNPLSSCLNSATVWPPSTANSPGRPLTIRAQYAFQSAMVMFWPGAPGVGPVGTLSLPASSTQSIQY